MTKAKKILKTDNESHTYVIVNIHTRHNWFATPEEAYFFKSHQIGSQFYVVFDLFGTQKIAIEILAEVCKNRTALRSFKENKNV